MIARLRLLRQLPAMRYTGVYPAVLVTVLAVLALLYGARSPVLGAPSAPAVTIISVTPAQGYNSRPTPILIRGGGFASSTKAMLGNVPLHDIVLVDSTQLSVTVPSNLPGGAYTLTVTNQDGTSASLPDAFTVLRSDDGSLGPWQYAPQLPDARAGLAAVRVGETLYVLGGRNRQHYSERAFFARVSYPHTSWSWIGRSMPNARAGHAAVAARGTFWVTGGITCTGCQPLATVFHGRPDGRFPDQVSWYKDPYTLTIGRYMHAAATDGDHVYVLGGLDASGTPLNSVEGSSIYESGNLAPWQQLSALAVPRSALGAAEAGGYLYALGGDATGSVERAVINPDGSLGPWQLLNTMTVPRTGLAAATRGGYLYAIGGDDYGTIERAVIYSDGTLGPWQKTSSLLTPRRYMAAVPVGPSLFVIGGWNETGHLASVEVAMTSPVTITEVVPRLLPSHRPVTVTIHGINFLPTPTLSFDSIPLADVTFVTSTTLTATVPAGVLGGNYGLKLLNPNGRSAAVPNVVSISRLGDGSLSRWRPTGSLPERRYGLAAVAAGGFVYTVGGRSPEYESLRTVEAAPINPDGSLGSWREVRALTAPRGSPQAVAARGFLYALGGNATGSVERARIEADGRLGNWISMPAIGIPVVTFATVLPEEYILVLGYERNDSDPYGWGISTVKRSRVRSDGSLAPWEELGSVGSGTRGQVAAVARGYLYVLGGLGGYNTTVNTVQRAAITAAGSLRPFETLGPMYTSRVDFRVAVADDFLYAIGGETTPYSAADGWPLSSVERARINQDGSLGPWQPVSSMRVPRVAFGLAQVGSVFYTIGGYDCVPYEDKKGCEPVFWRSVERARVVPWPHSAFAPVLQR